MKKFLLVIAAVAAFAFVGCNKDEDQNKEKGLAGTMWEYSYTLSLGGSSPNYMWNEIVTISFNGDGTLKWILKSEEGETPTNTQYFGTYVYDAPDVEIRISRGDEIIYYYGVVENSIMRVYTVENMLFGEFIKK